MKSGFEPKKLRDVCELVNGRAYGKPELLSEGKYRVLRVGNFFTNNHWYYSDLELEDKKYCDNGDLMYAWSASFGPRIWTGEKVIYHYHIWKVIPNPSVIEQRYLFHFFNWDTESIKEDQGAGTTMMHVSKGSMEDRDIQIPPLPEQRRIIAILDEAFDGIATAKANAEKNLQNARDLVGIGFQSITDSLGRSQWPIRQVETLKAPHKGAMRTGPFGSQLLHSEFVDEGIAVLGIDNAVANEFRWDRRRYITKEKYQQMARYRVFPGDVLITIMGTCGRCAVVPENIPLAINTKHLCCITLNREECLPDYLHNYFLHDHTARDYLTAQAKGSIMAGLNMGIISELPVRLPSIEIQAEIVDRFECLRSECDRLESTQRQKLTALDELKKSLLHRAFNGDL